MKFQLTPTRADYITLVVFLVTMIGVITALHIRERSYLKKAIIFEQSCQKERTTIPKPDKGKKPIQRPWESNYR